LGYFHSFVVLGRGGVVHDLLQRDGMVCIHDYVLNLVSIALLL